MMRMKFIYAFILIFGSSLALANTSHFSIKLDEFTLAKSSYGISDTIEITKSVWTSSDSVHVSAYICGGSQIDVPAIFMMRSGEEMVHRIEYNNHDVAFYFAFPTSWIDPTIYSHLAMYIGEADKGEKYGRRYRMGILKFI